jgi:hypothetical protein
MKITLWHSTYKPHQLITSTNSILNLRNHNLSIINKTCTINVSDFLGGTTRAHQLCFPQSRLKLTCLNLV